MLWVCSVSLLLLAVSADMGRAQPATSGGRRLVLGSLSSPRREKITQARQYLMAIILVLGSESIAAKVVGGMDKFDPSGLRSGVLPVTGDV